MNQLFYNVAGGIVHQIRRDFWLKRFAHAMSVHYRDLEHAYVYWIWLRGSASYVIILCCISVFHCRGLHHPWEIYMRSRVAWGFFSMHPIAISMKWEQTLHHNTATELKTFIHTALKLLTLAGMQMWLMSATTP